MWPSPHKPATCRKHWIYVTWVQSSIINTWTSIACATSNARNNRTRRTSAVWREILVRILSGYCSSAYQTGSPTCSEFTRIISTACDWNQVAYCSHSKACNFAQESPIEKIKVPFWSAINVFSDGVLIPVSTKCSKWMVYPERVTFVILFSSCFNQIGFTHYGSVVLLLNLCMTVCFFSQYCIHLLLWGQICCSVIYSNFSSSMHLLLKEVS